MFDVQFDFTGKTVVVVGASSGQGLAISRACAALGAHVVMASRSETKLNELRRTITGSTEAIAVDMLDETSVNRLFERVGSLDFVAVTAVADEVKMQSPFVSMTTEIAQRSLDKLWGSFFVARAAAPRIKPGGAITLTASTAMYNPPANGGYAMMNAASAAVASLGRSLAAELKPIRVNIVVPGVVNSGVWAGSNDEAREGLRRWASESLPVRHLGEPEELAQAHIFLMSNTYTTGAVLVVDGGGMLT